MRKNGVGSTPFYKYAYARARKWKLMNAGYEVSFCQQ